MQHPIEIGDITLTAQGPQVRLEIAEQRSWATWSVAGASMAVGWLLAWVRTQDGAGATPEGTLPILDKTLRQLIEEAR